MDALELEHQSHSSPHRRLQPVHLEAASRKEDLDTRLRRDARQDFAGVDDESQEQVARHEPDVRRDELARLRTSASVRAGEEERTSSVTARSVRSILTRLSPYTVTRLA